MGLHVQSLENIPTTSDRDYFIYLLDYGWDEPIRNALRENFDNMARKATTCQADVIKGTDIGHFENEVFSWHQINGMNADNILPALLITNKLPRHFLENYHGPKWGNSLYQESEHEDLKLILIPFKKFCKNTTEVITFIQKIFEDIIDKRELQDFQICKEMKKGIGSTIFDAVILEPNISGFGFNLKKLINGFRW